MGITVNRLIPLPVLDCPNAERRAWFLSPSRVAYTWIPKNKVHPNFYVRLRK